MSEQHQLTVPEAEKRTGIPSRTLRHAIQNAWLCAEKKGRDWLIKETDLVAYLNSERKPGPKPKSLLSLLSSSVCLSATAEASPSVALLSSSVGLSPTAETSGQSLLSLSAQPENGSAARANQPMAAAAQQ